MGSSHSKHRVATYPVPEKSKSRLSAKLSDLSLDDTSETAPSFCLEISSVIKWEEKLLADPKNRLALTALNGHAATAIFQKPSALQQNTHNFNHKIDLEGTPVTNQRSTGRCWIFAALNVFRIGLIRKYKLSSLELSQNYLGFWDKLEKANFFLEQVIDTLDQPLDGRLLQYLLHAPVNDGGQWDMIVSLVEKYGLVPQAVYQDTFNAKASGRINWLITAKLREAALAIREIAAENPDQPDLIQSYKAKVVQQIHTILTLAFGPPPKPEDTFTWNYYEKDGKQRCVTCTPLEFYRDNIGVVSAGASIGVLETVGAALGTGDAGGGVGERFSLVNDPRNPYMRLLTVERLGNVVGGRPVRYVNVDIDTMKSACIAMLQSHRPVFFGCDVGKFSDPPKGILDTNQFDYELGFNVTLTMTKAQRLQTGESAMTHAMMISGVHIVDGKPTKWRIENSWGDASGEKGYWVMSDDWMNEYCYQAVVDKGFVSKEVVEVLGQEPVVLPIWDAMGSLA